MSQDNCHSLVAPGSGTNRGNRLLESLLPSYVAVDARKIDELKAFAIGIAEQLRFAESKKVGDKETVEFNGDWKPFFEKKISEEERNSPHFALFLAFLQAFSLAQKELNSLSKKHLDFFYRDVLKLREKPVEADQAYLILQLAKHVHEYLLPKNTGFKAGKDDLGKEVTFKNLTDQVLNKTEVAAIQALYRDENSRFYKSSIANSSDGKGGEIVEPDGRWQSFGRPDALFPDSEREMAILGFAIASPTLHLLEGHRKIKLSLHIKKKEGILNKLLSLHLDSSFRFWLSGEEEWIEASPYLPESELEAKQEALDFINKASKWSDIAGIEPQMGPIFDNPEFGTHRPFKGYDIGEVTAKNILARRAALGGRFEEFEQLEAVRGMGKDKMEDLKYSLRTHAHWILQDEEQLVLVLNFHLNPDQAAVIGYSEEILLQKFKTNQPVLKVELTDTNQSYPYSVLKEVEVTAVDIRTEVKGVENLILQNDQSILPVGKNIFPFGFRPQIGSSFYIGSKEAFAKKLESLKLHFEWFGLPSNFGDHYTDYTNKDRKNESFLVQTALLDDKAWLPGPQLNLFNQENNQTLQTNQALSFESTFLEKLQAEPDMPSFTEWGPSIRRGFLRLSLAGIDFGHKEYPSDLAKAIIALNKDTTGNTPLPKEPYSPEIKSIKLDYVATDSFSLDRDSESDFFHIGAFGEAKLDSNPKGLNLLPDYEAEGILFIGLRNHLPAQSFQLLIHVLDGSGNPEKPVPTVNWSYLSDNTWISFDKLDITVDETKGLIQTGIIGFTPPKAANSSHTIHSDGLTWIRASVENNSDAIPLFTQILAQAIRVTFEDQENDPDRLAEALPAESISKLVSGQSQISKISQPFGSFGGKVPEQPEDFYQRISERLRHKQRAITRWDYEHLVLEQFPEIYQVKVLNHTFYDGNLEKYRALAPRHVTVVIIANVLNQNAIDPLRPKASVALIASVREFLEKINPPGVFLHVVNPIYEELQVKTKIKYRPGIDASFFTKKLEDEIKTFLSPWAYQLPEGFDFAGEVHSSQVLHFIEKRSYIDYLTCFELYQIIRNPVDGSLISKKRVEEAKGSTGISILGSAGVIGNYGDHLLEILEGEDCECPDNEIKAAVTIASSEDSDMDEAYET